jgi:hypothetical protein
MSITQEDIETFRDVAKAHALVGIQGRMRLPISCESSMPIGDLLEWRRRELKEIRRVEGRLASLDPDVVAEVLHVIRAANTQRHPRPCLEGIEIGTYHELALATPKFLVEALTALLEIVKTYRNRYAQYSSEPLKITLRSVSPGEATFRADRVVAAVERESAAAVKYLASCLPNAHAQPSEPNKNASRTKLPVTPKRDPDLEARDEWIFSKWCDGVPWSRIRDELATLPFKNRHFASIGGVIRAAQRYAQRHALRIPPKRRPGRPRAS